MGLRFDLLLGALGALWNLSDERVWMRAAWMSMSLSFITVSKAIWFDVVE